MKGKGNFFKRKPPMVKMFRIAFFPTTSQSLHPSKTTPNSHHPFPIARIRIFVPVLEKQMVLGADFQKWKEL